MVFVWFYFLALIEPGLVLRSLLASAQTSGDDVTGSSAVHFLQELGIRLSLNSCLYIELS